MAEPIISDLALRGVGSCPYEPEAQRTRFSILNKVFGLRYQSPPFNNVLFVRLTQGQSNVSKADNREKKAACQIINAMFLMMIMLQIAGFALIGLQLVARDPTPRRVRLVA
jgi:hypothetical protein